MLVIAIIVISLHMYWLERRVNPAYSEVPLGKGLGRALWRGFASYISQSTAFQPVTTSGSLLALMYGYVITLFWAGYTGISHDSDALPEDSHPFPLSLILPFPI